MDTSIYTGLGLQRLLHTINVWVDAPSGQKWWRKYHLKFAYCLDDIHLKPLNVLCLQFTKAYIFKKMTDLRNYIHIPFYNKSR
jgi:hypothetical protein